MSNWKRSRSPMHLTRAGDHGLRALLALLARPEDRLVTAHDLAQETRIPEEFLRKILTALARAGILRTVRGPAGGVRLARPPTMVSVLDVVEAVEGPVVLNECLRIPPACPLADTCPVFPVWKEAQEGLRATLAAANLATLGSNPARVV